jgi:hypothetical protein
MTPPVDKLYLVDLKDIREQYFKIIPEVRRTDVMFPPEYQEQEIFSMEIETLIANMRYEHSSGHVVYAYADKLLDDYQEYFKQEGFDSKVIMHAMTQYTDFLRNLAEALWTSLKEQGAYLNGALAGEYDSVLQNHLLVLRRKPIIKEAPLDT